MNGGEALYAGGRAPRREGPALARAAPEAGG
jgi:hypothetical protein